MIPTDETEDAFTGLSDATRLEIIRTLWDADGSGMTFTDLRESVGMDDSGQFNYHLDRLTGRFVTKNEHGYSLTRAGQLVYGSILSGAYAREESIEPIPLSNPCPACGGSRTLSYDDETVRVECDSCDISPSAGVPPGVFAGYDREEIPAVASRYFRTIVQQVDNGFCWYCEGRTSPTVVALSEIIDDDVEPADDSHELPVVQYGCERCGSNLTVNLGNSLLEHPAVVSFFHEHDVNVNETSLWEFATWNTERTLLVERDPLRARVSYHTGDDRLDILVDETLTVLDVERSSTRS